MQHMSRLGSGKEAQSKEKVDYTNSELLHLINEYIHSERDREILKRRLVDGICYEPLAEEFDLSVRQIKNIVCKNEIRIFKH